MVPATFSNFFLAMAGAGAGLVGLLFVAISVNPTRILGAEGQPEHQVMAESTFSCLVNGFFLSCGALLPVSGVGYIGIVFATLGLIATARLTIWLARTPMSASPTRTARVRRLVRVYLITVVSFALYGYELIICTRLLGPTISKDNLIVLCNLLLALYGVALVRAWELLGARRGGFTGWLNPLTDLPPPRPEKASEQPQTRQSAKRER